MTLAEHLKELRKQKDLTQEELAEKLFVSRTAISKWESGRGYPSIDSLQQLATFFALSIDDLLSGEEIVSIAEDDRQRKNKQLKDLVFGLLDCSLLLLLFLPFFAYESDGNVIAASLINLKNTELYLLVPYYVLIMSIIIFGILTLALQNLNLRIWQLIEAELSLAFSALATILLMITTQPYAGVLVFVLLLIKLSVWFKTK